MRKRSLLLALIAVLFAASRATAAAYVVTSTEDTPGFGSLRQAITLANAGGVAASISFNLAIGCATPCVIQLSSALPAITVPVTIDAYTQPGSSPNTLPVGDNAVRKVILDVNHISAPGLTFTATGVNSLVRGLQIINYGTGAIAFNAIESQADGFVLEGNQIGPAYSFSGGVLISGGSNVRIGGTAPAQRNSLLMYVTACGDGMLVQGNSLYISIAPNSASVGTIAIGGTAAGAGNVINGGIHAISNAGSTIGALTIQGNTIGLDGTGTVALGGPTIDLVASGGAFAPALIGGNTASARNIVSPGANGTGIHVTGLPAVTIQGNYIGCSALGGLIGLSDFGIDVEGNGAFGGTATIGGSGPGEGNVIVAGELGGVRVVLTTASIKGNVIGLAPDGKTRLGNAIGVLVDSADASIGGPTAGEKNVIAGNYNDGVRVAISMPAIRNAATANVSGNAIYANAGLGINFSGTGQAPLPNDPGDGDTGPNGLQNYPILSAASISGGQVFVSGDLDSMPNTLYRIEWFANTVCDPSGYGEGRVPLGGSGYMTDGSGHVAFTGVMLPIPTGYSIITATATDPPGNTSEFSSCFTAAGPNSSFHTLSPCRLSDTRNANGPYGGPSFDHGEQRSYVAAGQCGVPSNAVSVALNVAVTAPSGAGNLVLFPGEAARPTTSTINYGIGRTKSDSTIVPLGPSGDFSVFANQAVGRVDVIIDVTGYFQ
jgi:hypothetical protein